VRSKTRQYLSLPRFYAGEGHRRTNADKRRCVEIAIAELNMLSSRAIAELCGVEHHFVGRIREQLGLEPSSTLTGTDGKQRPAKHKPKAKEEAPVRSVSLRSGRPAAITWSVIAE